MATAYPHAPAWEEPLLALAADARRGAVADEPRPACDRSLLAQAYRQCASVTAARSHTFFAATRLLPPDKRRAMRALYAFCRQSDDIVDAASPDADAVLAAWQQRATAPLPPPADLIAVAWADTRARYRIPPGYADQLIAGVARDLHQRRYATFADLASYAYGVASTVGLMSMHIIGFSGPEAIPYAIKLGIALQLTNILRDVGEDWRMGRVYLPQDELAGYGVSEDDLAHGTVDARWRALMRFQRARAARLYDEAWPGLALLDRDGRLAVAAAATFYRAILDDIAAHDDDVFTRRAHVGTWDKLRRLPLLWWSTR